MQRAAQTDERSKKQEEEVKPDGDSELVRLYSYVMFTRVISTP